MKVAALLTGRGNSTFKDKNIQIILGHAVLYYPAHAAKMARTISEYYCSSDDIAILAEAEREGYKRIQRPAELALPTSQHVDAILHALETIRGNGELPDILVVLLANNVTIKSEWIDRCVEMMQADMTLSAVVPVYQDNDHHPLRAKIPDGNGRLQMYEKGVTGRISTNRQDLPTCFFLAHNFWVLNTWTLIDGFENGQQPWSFMGNEIGYFEISESIDIHKETDLMLAQDWIEKNYTD